MTVKATFTAAYPEARRIAEFLERDHAESGVAVSLSEADAQTWAVEAYVDGDDTDSVAAMLTDGLGMDGFAAPLRVEVLPDTDWVAASQRVLAPVSAGRFLVHGSHDRDAVPAGRILIEVDAGEAFGTGHHATTAGCLSIIDGLIGTRRFANPLDIGTGSGVLAIALAKANRAPVVATDIDPVAVRVARGNALLNGVANRIRLVQAKGPGHAEIRRRAPYDLIVANILAEPLCRMAPAIAPLLAQDGVLVLSGLLPGQRARVVAAYAGQRVALVKAHTLNGWSVLVLKRARV